MLYLHVYSPMEADESNCEYDNANADCDGYDYYQGDLCNGNLIR